MTFSLVVCDMDLAPLNTVTKRRNSTCRHSVIFAQLACLYANRIKGAVCTIRRARQTAVELIVVSSTAAIVITTSRTATRFYLKASASHTRVLLLGTTKHLISDFDAR